MKPLAAVALVLASLLASASARAYCRASACEDGYEGQICDPPGANDCGKPLAWKRPCIGMAVQQDASDEVDYPTAKGALRAAFDAWEAVDCGGGATPDIHVELLNKVSCAKVEYNKAPSGKGNVNVLVFRDDAWPGDKAHQGAIALTTVQYDPETGEINGADIEVDTHDYEITTAVPTGGYDLVAVLTHEAGHVLGLAHSPEPGATMIAQFTGDSVQYRSLEADDERGICAIFPTGDAVRSSCNPIPRHGYSPDCADEQPDPSCALAPAPRQGIAGLMLAVAAAIVLAIRRPRRGRVPRP